jgi:hypothetical protein
MAESGIHPRSVNAVVSVGCGSPSKNNETATACNRISLDSTPINRHLIFRRDALRISSYGMLRHVVAAVFLCGILTLAALLFPALTTAQVLDRIEIVETPTTAEIHIVFNTRAFYLRHTPSEKGDFITIYLDFPDQDRSRRFARELTASPPSDLIPKFLVTFPDQGTNGLSVRFEKPVRFRISQRGIPSASRIVVAVKLDRPATLPPVPPETKISPATPPVAKDPKLSFDIPPFGPGKDVETYV